jgi:hypothetical protein
LASFYNQGMRRGILERDAELALLANAVRESLPASGTNSLARGSTTLTALHTFERCPARPSAPSCAAFFRP